MLWESQLMEDKLGVEVEETFHMFKD